MTPDIYLKVDYPVDEPEKFRIETNAKAEAVADLIEDFLYGQVGAGVDRSQANEFDVYEIILGIDLSDDSWGTKDNCGNKGLRDGILYAVLGRITKSQNLDWLSEPPQELKFRWQKFGF